VYEPYLLLQGNTEDPGSYRLINERLTSGLRQRGQKVVVFGSDERAAMLRPSCNPTHPPEIYLHHSWPFDLRSAPGRINVFILAYEYSRPRPLERNLISALNSRFDLTLVPTRFVAEMLREQGLEIPVSIVPWGYEPAEFGVNIEPAALGEEFQGHFVFLYVGAANARKGFDLALEAYRQEFGREERVVLVLKESYRMRHMQPWIDRVARRHQLDSGTGRERSGARVVWINDHRRSVASLCRRADVGLFPFRGEGFGLALLECLACGTSVIATDGTGPLDFCNRGNSRLVAAEHEEKRGIAWLRPDLATLRRVMRNAFNAGAPSLERRAAVARSVADWTWEKTCDKLCIALASAPPRQRSSSPRLPGPTPAVGYIFAERGRTSWKKHATWFDRALASHFPNYRSAWGGATLPSAPFDILMGQSEFCLEAFQQGLRLNPRVKLVLHSESTWLEARLAIVNAEREACEMPPLRKSPMELWRSRQEAELADMVVVSSEFSRRLFVEAGCSPERVRVLPLGFTLPRARRIPRQRNGPLRFLFVATDPFRKGVRQLFEAWDALQLPNAQLICRPALEIMHSRPLLKLVTRNPSIVLRHPVAFRGVLGIYDEVDCQVLPSLEDGFSLAVADGMARGVPAIVSRHTGVQDLLTDGVDSLIVPAGCVDSLAGALQRVYEEVELLPALGKQAYLTALRWPWSRTARGLANLLSELA
jgi:glycosyltransferase involved in cell wall biosynthesis